MKKNPVALLFLFTLTALYAKRPAPEEVKPVYYKGCEYRVVHFSFEYQDKSVTQNGGYIEIWNRKTGEYITGVLIYENKYDSGREHDTQDVFITGMKPDRKTGSLLITNERGDTYRFDINTKKVIKIP